MADSPAQSEFALNRRVFIGAAGTSVVAGGLGVGLAAAGSAEAAGTPFALGVASGDATTSSVVLWTRLVRTPTDPANNFGLGGRTEAIVKWRVATSPDRLGSDATSVKHGQVRTTTTAGFSVHVDVAGLSPGRHYYYRFRFTDADGTVRQSSVGRTKTAYPSGDDRTVRFAVVNCQNIAGPDGVTYYFNGMNHLADRTGTDDLDFVIFLGDYIYEFGRAAHIPPKAVDSLNEYRMRYGQYKARASLQKLHRRYPVYVVPDDHEFWNDVAGGALSGHQVGRFNRALEAYWEHMPVRDARPGPVSSPTKNHLRLYGAINWGMLSLFLTDVRQYRRGQTLLGDGQRTALLDWLRTTKRRWTTIATPTPIWAGGGGGWSADTATRDAVTRILRSRKTAPNTTFNPMVLSGDLHCAMVTHVRRGDALVATEFLNAPMTSQAAGEHQAGGDVRKVYNHQNGYMVCAASRSEWTTRYFLGNDVTRPDGTVAAARAWRVRNDAAVGSVHQV